MALDKQIIREYATYANLIAVGGDNELQLYMIGIATDTDEFIFRSDDGYHRCLDSGTTALSEHSIPFINSSGKVVQDNTNLQFNNGTNVLTTYELTTLSDINAAEYIKRSGVDDDYIRFENDKITIEAGGATAMVFEDDKVYTELNMGVGETAPRVQFEVGGKLQVNDKLIFTQDDENEYIDSLADGYLDLGATTQIRNQVAVLMTDKVSFTQTDGNEYIDSLADGYMDYGATTAHRFNTADFCITVGSQITSDLNKFGFGKTSLEDWVPALSVLQIGGQGSLLAHTTEGASGQVVLCQNGYEDVAGWKRFFNDEVTLYQQQNGNHIWYSDAAGTADEAFTVTQRMRLTSANLSTASVQLGLGTATPMLNVGSAAGDFTGDGIHIKSDVANDRQAYLIIEGDATPSDSGWNHAGASLIFSHYSGGAGIKLFECEWTAGIFTFRALDDDTTPGNSILKLDVSNQYITHYHATEDVIWKDADEDNHVMPANADGWISIDVNNTDYWVPFYVPPS